SASFAFVVATPVLSLTPETLADAAVGTPYVQAFTASGGVAPYRYTLADGALPAGLALDPATGALAGTPEAEGSFEFSINATDATTGTPGSATRSYTLVVAAPVIVVDPESLAEAIQGVD